ncbi:SGNH/GDSL hydrolase family protein [Proteiniphilum sp. UBA5384]|uniref:SGNH/GDSL hydrolase family protein n=1 Tax=Proteiniphilum sp. UBA5384 TaxID=1947279 RepID=UPI0025F382BA|nr:SGNH/GDSL hydrolase family protein [Proteiniphilum sp. UBA5384]
MNRIIFTLLAIILYLDTSQIRAQTAYYDADQFPLIGKASDETETRYERLPAYLKDACRPPVWDLGKNTSGLAIRFRTNSTAISAKWEVAGDNRMNHMTETGIKGVDLYTWEGYHWQPVKAGLPSGKVNEQTIISNMTSQEREYMLFLPLYDGVVSLSVGVDSSAYIKKPALPYPDTTHPILVYGTSITQGGCATRPGMSYTNILARRLNREVINLGFSGNGQLDYEIAELMATRRDASLFILDFIPNVNAKQLTEKTKPFFDILRKANPETPILFVETVIFPHSYYDKNIYGVITEKNRLLREEYEKIKREGDKNIYYLANDELIGNDGEATVDGIHFTDLGFLRFSDKLHDTIQHINIQ